MNRRERLAKIAEADAEIRRKYGVDPGQELPPEADDELYARTSELFDDPN